MFNNDFRELINEQLGENYKFLKAYHGFEDNELRIIAQDENGWEHRYIIIDGRLVEKP
jgi:hypothetical protein